MSDNYTFAMGLRVFWALFLATMLAVNYRSAWRMENRKENNFFGTQKDAVVWLDPLIFPEIFALVIFLYFISDGVNSWIQILGMMLDVFVFLTVYFSLLLLILPFLRKYFAARTCAILWLIPLFLYYSPVVLETITVHFPLKIIYIPEKVLMFLVALWLAGFLFFMISGIVSHLMFSVNLKQNSYLVENTTILEKWENLKNEMEISNPISLKYCTQISTPLTIGMRKKNQVTYLPECSYTAEEAKLILSHELHHIQRNDTHTKFFLRFCRALGWLHPLVWVAVKRAEDDLELSCDEIVLKDADSCERKKYAKLLLSTAGNSQGFTTCLSASAKNLRYRMKAILQEDKKKVGIWLVFFVMFFSCFFSGNLVFATDRKPVGEVTGLNTNEVVDVSYFSGENKTVGLNNETQLIQYLSGLETVKIIRKYDSIYEKCNESVSISFGDGRTWSNKWINIYGEYMECNNEDGFVLYHITEEVDWDYIEELCSE